MWYIDCILNTDTIYGLWTLFCVQIFLCRDLLETLALIVNDQLMSERPIKGVWGMILVLEVKHFDNHTVPRSFDDETKICCIAFRKKN